MKKGLAILFLLIFSFQVLPVKAIGKLMSKAQNTEEVEDASSDNVDGKAKFGEDFIIPHFSFGLFSKRIYFIKKQSAIIHKAESLPPIYSREVQSPPPDRI